MTATEPGSVVITGVSTGIGWGAAKVCLANGMRVFGSVRKPEDGERLQTEFGAEFTPLLFDVTDEAAVGRAAQQVRETLNGQPLAGLVNNAGIAVPGPLQFLPVSEFRRQLEVNLVGPLIVTQAFASLLGAEHGFSGKPGRIVNISSVAGQLAAPFLGAYAASKHGLEGFSDSLRRELLLYGIDVIVVGPGSVVTPIWNKAEVEDLARYNETDYGPTMTKLRDYMMEVGRGGLPAEKIGEVIHTALTTRRPRARYAVLKRSFMDWTLPNLLPRRIVDRAIVRRIGYGKR